MPALRPDVSDADDVTFANLALNAQVVLRHVWRGFGFVPVALRDRDLLGAGEVRRSVPAWRYRPVGRSADARNRHCGERCVRRGQHITRLIDRGFDDFVENAKPVEFGQPMFKVRPV